MSPEIRGLSIIVLSLFFVCIFYIDRARKRDLSIRCYHYLFYLSFFFPFIDLSFSYGRLFDIVTWLFVLFNLNCYKKVHWKSFSLMGLLILVYIISAIASEFPKNSLESIPSRILFVIPIIATWVVVDKYPLTSIYKLIKWPVIWTILFGVIQLLIDSNFTLYFSVWHKEARISSCARDPQIAGCLAAMLIVFLWNLRKTYSKKIKVYPAILLLAIVGAYTGSKSFVLGCAIGLLSSVIYQRHAVKSIMALIALGGFLLFTQDFWMQLPLFARFQDMDASFDGRENVFWVEALDIFQSHPFTGIGVGNFQLFIENYLIQMTHFVNGEHIYATQPESGYLLWLDEIGILCVVYLAFFIYFLSKRGNDVLNPSILVAWMVTFFSLYNLTSSHIVLILSMVIGSVCNTAYKQKHRLYENRTVNL